MSRLTILSLWRNDEVREIHTRIEHLLAKEWDGEIRWLWVVGDSVDETEFILRQAAKVDARITVLRHDTGRIDWVKGSDNPERMLCLSETVGAGLAAVGDDGLVLVHESDLVSPVDVATRLSRVGRVVGGWPTLVLPTGEKVFYDTWAYRKNGVRFSNRAPYHSCHRTDGQPYQVDSVGSVMLFPAEHARAIIPKDGAIVEMCRKLKKLGEDVWVDPTTEIVQPTELWRR